MAHTNGAQTAKKVCTPNVGAPRRKTNGRGAPSENLPTAQAVGATIAKVPKPRRRFTRITVFDRKTGEDIVFKFQAGQRLPSLILPARQRDYDAGKYEIIAGFKFIYGPKKGTKPAPVEEVKLLTSKEARKAWVASLPKLEGEVTAETEPAVDASVDQWFRVELPREALEVGRRSSADHDFETPAFSEEFPDGWCAKLVQPQPESCCGDAKADPDWTYVQLPFHFEIYYNGGAKTVRKTHHGSNKKPLHEGQVECGMWLPKWVLTPISEDGASEIYEQLAASATD